MSISIDTIERPSFNRTMVGLKRLHDMAGGDRQAGFNRTMVGLKLFRNFSSLIAECCFNRTMVGLKRTPSPKHSVAPKVLIELW